MIREAFWKLWNDKKPLKEKLIDVYSFLLGNYRYKLYYSKHWKWLIRTHIREQIDFRIKYWMDKECYQKGECKICGCMTTALQMADRACDKPCYPKLMSRIDWAVYCWISYDFGLGKDYLFDWEAYNNLQKN